MYLTKGDTASISVSLEEPNGYAYTFKSGDRAVLTVRDKVGGSVLFTATANAPAGEKSVTISIPSSATSGKNIGQYAADVQCTLASGVYTVWPIFKESGDKRIMTGEISNWDNFWILPEVTS